MKTTIHTTAMLKKHPQHTSKRIMADTSLPPLLFQTFFVSRENSNSPLISDMMRYAKAIRDNSFLSQGKGSVSVSVGNRILITGEDVKLRHLSVEDIVDIVDYDPIKNVVLAAGKLLPCSETPLHWMIQRARHDVHAVAYFSLPNIPEAIQKKFPVSGPTPPIGTLESIKEALKTVREGKTVILKNRGILFIGFTLSEIQEASAVFKKEMSL